MLALLLLLVAAVVLLVMVVQCISCRAHASAWHTRVCCVHNRTWSKGILCDVHTTASTQNHQPAPNSAPDATGPYDLACNSIATGVSCTATNTSKVMCVFARA